MVNLELVAWLCLQSLIDGVALLAQRSAYSRQPINGLDLDKVYRAEDLGQGDVVFGYN